MRNDDVSNEFPGIKELKELTDMWDPHVSDWAHGGLSPPSHWIWRPVEVARGADVDAT